MDMNVGLLGDFLQSFGHTMGNGLPLDLLEEGHHCNGDVGQHKQREGETVEDLLTGGAVDVLPLGDSRQGAEEEGG